MDLAGTKFLIVGAGLFGSVLAERIANDMEEKVIIIDRRDHIGGNCYSEIDEETGIEYHKYGVHVFHTSNREVWEYINLFSTFISYQHQVLASWKDNIYQLPVNLNTINSVFQVNLKPYEVDNFLDSDKLQYDDTPKNAEEAAINKMGFTIYKGFFYNYTMKQWEVDPKYLPVSIIDRIPFRKNYNNNYYKDIWQGLPENGYANLFYNMLLNPKISIFLNTDYSSIRKLISSSCTVIYTGKIDEFFNGKLGSLEWRSLKFKKEIRHIDDFQGVAQMNFPEKHIKHIRIYEPKHLYPHRGYKKDKTLLIYEYPESKGDPFYPVLNKRNQDIFEQYELASRELKNVFFGGRLGNYKYYNMDEVISTALKTYEVIKKNK